MPQNMASRSRSDRLDLYFNVRKFDADKETIAPDHAAMPPCVTIRRQQQNETFRQLAFVLKLNARTRLRYVGNCAGKRLIALDQDSGVIVKLAAWLLA
jgi:hypothetical protein